MHKANWYTVEQLPWPTNWDSLFGRPAPMMLEIGFGSGQFLTRLAQRRLEANIVGLEISLPSLRNAASKIERARLNNVILLHASAKAALTLLFEPRTLSEVYINYPDPWPKKAHFERRLINDEFLELLASRTMAGASLDINTDHETYAPEIDECLAATPYFISRRATSYSHDTVDRVGTKYEQVAIREGRICYHFRWQRNDTEVEKVFTVPKEQTMPHIILRAPVGVSEIAQQFQPFYVESPIANVKFLEAYQSLHTGKSLQIGKVLIETFVNEDPLKQHVCLAIRERDSGDMIIEMNDIGFPRPTAGIHQAIQQLANWIVNHYPATVVVHSNLM